MAEYFESGLRLDLPAGRHFRFSDLPAYRLLSGRKLKEMDFAWIDTGKLFLLEVRSFVQIAGTLTDADLVPAKGRPAPFRFDALIDKITDSVLMLLAAWADTTWGRQLKAELPAAAQATMPLKLVVAIELPATLTVHLQGLRDALNARLKGRVALADVKSVALIDYGRLIREPAFKGMATAHP
ncbi:hypothetical protein GT347_17720 [Xylophilus rhododendri]|uniref:Uncharacterized protein n=1 Tax=Xylophilus rhododendri TaxID=2697032 RepID=A0A857J8V3_9BURK|nr:hypothetical protein [Xylophilus rhododendri]QHI99653.1 hypothetical protein GT347_17720 [Xylophilus rhododendri]